MTATCRPTAEPVRTVLATASLLVAGALAVGLAACGPEPAEIDRSPVAGMTAENPEAGEVEDRVAEPARNRGSLTLTGGVAFDGPATVECGPAAPPAETGDDEEPAIGRLGGEAEEPQPGEEAATATEDGGHHAAAPAAAVFAVRLSPAAVGGLAVTLRLPGEGEVVEVPLTVALVDGDGVYRRSTGTARVTVDDGSMLTRSAATDHVSGSFTGSYQGEAGAGEARGRFTRCFYFD